MVNDFAFRVEQQGLRLEDYLKYMGQTMEQFRASFMPQAEKQVKIRLALEAVAAAEIIEASKAIDFIKSHANIVEKAAEEEKAADAE